MKILDIVKEISNGCYWVRNKIPFEALQKRGHIIENSFNNNLLDVTKHNLLHFSRMYEGNYAEIVTKAKENGLKIIYDIDDGADVVLPENIYYSAVMKSLPSFYYLLNQADLVTTTTPELAEHLKKHGAKKVVVLPNALDKNMWLERKGNNKIPRIGFAGSNTHIVDIAMVMEALIELKKQGKEFQFVIFGFSAYPDTAFDWIKKNRENMKEQPSDHPFLVAINKFEELYKQLEDRIEWKSMCPMEMYPERLSELNLDIGVCPLVDTPFNRLKSAIKFYEYALTGSCVIASDIPPYQTEEFNPCVLTNDWVKTLSEYLDDTDLRERTAKMQNLFVSEKRTIDAWVDAREQAYLELLDNSNQVRLE